MEKHFREPIMLFTPWRNEETDLPVIDKCSSYEECFYILKDGITEQMRQYAVCSDELDNIQEQMHLLPLTSGKNILQCFNWTKV